MSKIKKKFIRFGTGAEDVNAQSIPANYTPVNYVPDEVGTEGDDKISAHLKGLDAAVSGSGAAVYTNTIVNNQTSPDDITDALFDPDLVRGAEVSFNIYRSTNSTEVASTGIIYLAYLITAQTWSISYDSTSSNAGVTFDITDLGQLNYISSNMAGTGYSGDIKYTFKLFAI